MYVVLILVFCFAINNGLAVSEKDFQDLQNQMMTLKNFVQHMATEFGGLRQQHTQLEQKYQALTEEIRDKRWNPVEFSQSDELPDYPTLKSLTETDKSTPRNTRVVTVCQKGDKGDTGPVGPKGDNGIPGFNGDDGLDGLPGQKGERGDLGLKGPKGDNGIPGFNGDDGIDGPPGQKGDKGEHGARGPKGDNGTPGLNGGDGSDGTPGQKGDKGGIGLRGRKGDRGTTGVNGARGPKGEPGHHASGTKVGFSARMSLQNHFTKGTQHTLTFENIKVDIGNDYNQATGVFICSIPGTYIVAWSLEAGSGTYITSTLMKNGAEVARLEVLGPALVPIIGSQVVLVDLDVRDRIYISANPVNLYSNAVIKSGSTFTAFMLH